MDTASNLAMFLLDKTGDVCGQWRGRLTAQQQRVLFGKVLAGKREIRICGKSERILAIRKVGFGQDWETEEWTWKELS